MSRFYYLIMSCALCLSLGTVWGQTKPSIRGTMHEDGRNTPKLFIPSAGGNTVAGEGRKTADSFLTAHKQTFAVDPGQLNLISTRESLLGTDCRYLVLKWWFP
jgi:hypothetical protein